MLDREAFYAMNGDPVWRCQDGTRIRVSMMSTSHIQSVLDATKRGYTNDRQPFRVKKPQHLARLKLELAFREANKC